MYCPKFTTVLPLKMKILPSILSHKNQRTVQYTVRTIYCSQEKDSYDKDKKNARIRWMAI
jgi:hypothetical protein